MLNEAGIQVKSVLDDGRIFIDLKSGDKNPCADCGVCCAHFRISFYFGELDVMEGGFVPTELTEKVNGTFACMGGTNQKDKRCSALVGDIGKDAKCSIYENRPSPCREFNVWDDLGIPNVKCQELRFKNGIPLLENIKNC